MALQIEAIVKTYGRRRVVDGVSLRVDSGEIVGLLGPNGAGKTTTFHSITGFVRPDSGQVRLDDDDLTRLPMYQRARLGIGYLPQETSIFRGLTVAQTVAAVLEARGVKRAEREHRVAELLAELNLAPRAGQRADTLSGGETRRVEIARALATRPRYMLLDEPFTGIDPRTVQDIQTIVRDLRAKGLSILITDHNALETLQITDRAYIMVDGRILPSGTARELTEDKDVRRLYLGERFRLS